MLDAENWEIVFEVYSGRASAALALAFQLTELKQCLQRGRKSEAIAGLDLAIDSLFQHTDFYKMSRRLYRQRLDGSIKPKQEEKLRELGVKL